MLRHKINTQPALRSGNLPMLISKSFVQYSKNKFRQIHRFLAPIMLFPVVLTLLTGMLYQLFDMAGQEDRVHWLMGLHKGDFRVLNLESIYPLLNGLGLLILVVTGFSMWLQTRRNGRRREAE